MKQFKRLLLLSLFLVCFLALTVLCASAATVARVESTGTTYSSLGSAIAAAGNDDTVTLLGSTTLSPVTVSGKSVTIDGDGYTVTRTDDYTAALFTVGSNASLTLKDLTVTSNGSAISVTSASAVTLSGSTALVSDGTCSAAMISLSAADSVLNMFDNASINAAHTCVAVSAKATIFVTGAASMTSTADYYNIDITGGNATVTLEGAIMNGKGNIRYNGTGTLTLTISGGLFNAATSGSCIYVSSSSTSYSNIDAQNATFVATGTADLANTSCIGINTPSKVKMNVRNSTLNAKGRCFNTVAGCTIKATLESLTAKTSDSHGIAYFSADNNSTVDIIGGQYINSPTAEMCVQFSGSVTGTIYDGYFEAYKLACARSQGNSTLVIYGGTFNYTGDSSSTGSPIRVGTGNGKTGTKGTVKIYGGTFRSGSAKTPVFNTNHELCTIYLYGYNAKGYANLITNWGTGTASANHQNGSNFSSLNAPEMTTGAAPRLVKNETGLRFVTNYSKATLNYLKNLSDDGVLSFGTVFVLTDNIKNSGDLTAIGFMNAGTPYVDVAASNGLITNSDGSITVRASITDIPDNYLETAVSALGYVAYTVNGNRVYFYTNYNEVKHSRSAYQVARAALTDTSEISDTLYTEDMGDGNYSPYTEKQRNYLTTWWNNPDEVKHIDLFLIAGQSNAAGYSDITDAFRNAYPQYEEGIPNIFFSSGVPTYQTQKITLADGTSTKSFTHHLNHPTAVGTTLVKFGQGLNDYEIGPELGMAAELSKYYNPESGRYAGIVKYAVGGTTLNDISNGSNSREGNWFPPSAIKANGSSQGSQTGTLYRNLVARVKSDVEDYRALGFTVSIKALYWMQGESDDEVANATTVYKKLFGYLISDLRSDLNAFMPNQDVSKMNVMVGEISGTFGFKETTHVSAFVEMQRTLANTYENVHVIPNAAMTTSKEDTSHWSCGDAYYIGRMAGSEMLHKVLGQTQFPHAINADENVEMFDSKGNSLGKYTSLSYAAYHTPKGGKVKLLKNINMYGPITIYNKNAITVDGNGYIIQSYSVNHAVEMFGSDTTLNNFKLRNNTNDAGAYAINCFKNSKLTITGANTSINSYAYGIVLNESNITLNFKGGSLSTRYGNEQGHAPIFSGSDNKPSGVVINISGGTITAIDKGSAIRVNANGTTKTKLTISGGTITGGQYCIYATNSPTVSITGGTQEKPNTGV